MSDRMIGMACGGALLVIAFVSAGIFLPEWRLATEEQGAVQDAARASITRRTLPPMDGATSFTISSSAGAPFTALLQRVEYRCPVCGHTYHVTAPVGDASSLCLVKVRMDGPDGRPADLCWNPCPHCLRRILRDVAGVPEMVRREVAR